MSAGNTLYRMVNEDLPMLSHWVSDGSIVRESNGRYLLDLSSGPCCFSLGHNNSDVKDAIGRQMEDMPNAFSGWWCSSSSERAGAAVRREFERMKPGWFGRVVFQQGGGEAVDFACKIAAQYHLEAGRARLTFAARDYAYHGVGSLPAALTDHYPRYGLMEPYRAVCSVLVDRLPHPIDCDLSGGLDKNEVLDETKLALRVGHNAAVIIEPVGGPTIAAYPDPKWYLEQLRQYCDDTDTLLIFDEILCGSGRCGEISVAGIHDVWPDIVLLGKGLSAGYQPVSAIVLSQRVVERIANGSGQIMFGTSHGAHSMGCAAVAATLDYIAEHDLCASVRRNFDDWFYGEWCAAMLDVPIVTRISGMGYLLGLSLTTPKGDPLPIEAEAYAHARTMIRDTGAIVYTKGRTMKGVGDFITIAPPFEMPPDKIREGMAMVRSSLFRLSRKLGY